MIIEMTHEHVPAVAAIHRQVLPNDLLSRLGISFMERYLYSKVIDSPWAVGYVYLYNQRVVGYITGTTNSAAFYRYTWSEMLTLPFFLLPSLICRPMLLGDLTEAMEFSRVKNIFFVEAEIASVGVLPEYRSIDFYKKTKLNIAAELNRYLIRDLRSIGIKELFGIFRSDNTPAIVTYQNLGFTLRQEFTFRGSQRLILGCNLQDERLAERLQTNQA